MIDNREKLQNIRRIARDMARTPRDEDIMAELILESAEASLAFIGTLRTVISGAFLVNSEHRGLYRPLYEIGARFPAIAAALLRDIDPPRTPVDAVLVGYLRGGLAQAEPHVSPSPLRSLDKAGEDDIVATVIAVRVAYLNGGMPHMDIEELFINVVRQGSGPVLNHVLHFALDHYNEDPSRWFTFLNTVLMKATPENRRVLWARLAMSRHRLLSEHFFALTEHSKTDESAISDIGAVLIQYPDCPGSVMGLIFLWIEHGLIWNFPVVKSYLHQLAEINPAFITEYLVRYRTWHRGPGYGHEPILFDALVSADLMVSVTGLELFDRGNERDLIAVHEIAKCILSCCNDDKDLTRCHLPVIRTLYQYLLTIWPCTTHPLTSKAESRLLEAATIKDTDYRALTGAIEAMIARMQEYPQPFKPKTAREVLADFGPLERLVSPIVDGVERGEIDPCSPILDYLMLASLPEDRVHARDRTRARELLDIIEQGVTIFCSSSNDSVATLVKEDDIRAKLIDRRRFWPLVAELLLYCILEPVILAIDPTFEPRNKKNLDLMVSCGDVRLVIEIKAPLPNQDVRMSMGAFFFKSRSISAIGEKTDHFHASGAMKAIQGDPTLYGLIALEISELPLPWAEKGAIVKLLTLPPRATSSPTATRRYLQKVFHDIEDKEMVKRISDNVQNISGFILYRQKPRQGGGKIGIHYALVPNPLTCKPLPDAQIEKLAKLLARDDAS